MKSKSNPAVSISCLPWKSENSIQFHFNLHVLKILIQHTLTESSGKLFEQKCAKCSLKVFLITSIVDAL